jgi:hypothetical protein
VPFMDKQVFPVEKAIGVPEFADVEPGFKDVLLASYRTENTLGSFIAKEGGLPDSAVTNPDFNPLDYMSEVEKMDGKFIDNAILADNVDEVESVRRQIERERSDRGTISQGGLAPMFLAAVADPVNFIPVGGTAYRTYRTGASILHGARVTSMVAAGSSALTEGGLQYSQLTRTYGESAVNIGAAAFLGGVLGAAPGAVKRLLSDSGIDETSLYREIEEVMSPEEVVNGGFNSAAPAGDKSMGAAQVMDDPQVRGKLARAMTKFIGFDPLSRTITSDAKASRVTTNRLAENPIAVDGGLTRTSVESKVKVYDGLYYKAIEQHHSIFKEYKKGGGALTRQGFNEEVSRALRNGSDDDLIKKSAEAWRREVYLPIKDKAIEARLLPEDVDVTTADSYLNRVWNKNKLSAKMPAFIDTVSSWLMARNAEMELFEAQSLAGEIAVRIQGTPDGRLPYDYQIGKTSTGSPTKAGLSGTFKKRSFDIPDDLVEDFLENDIEELAQRYIRSTAPDIEIVKEFDDIDMTAAKKDIADEYQLLIEGAATEKERIKISKVRDRDIRDIAAMRDRIRGTYNIADPNNPWVRAGRVMRDLNYMRLLGGVVASSIPDVARVVAAEGIVRTFKSGLVPLANNLSGFKVAAKEAKSYGIGIDALMGGRAEILADIGDYSKSGTAFERGVNAAARKFSTINLMNHWTSGVKQLHAVTTQTRIIDELSAGKYDQRLKQLGIDEGAASSMAKEIKRHAKKIDNVWVANADKWEDQGLAGIWRAALRNESDRVVIVPGQEKPLFMSTEMGKTIFQFKSFMLSATQRMLIGGLQGRDAHYMQGAIGLVSLGMMSYAFKQWDAGREIESDPRALVVEGIDRSGMLGVLMEMNNTMEKISSNNIGLRPILGISAPASRYASRSVAESAVGPTFGLINDAVRAANGISSGQDWTEADTRALRRLIPMQNLSIMRQAFDKIESGINDFSGVK